MSEVFWAKLYCKMSDLCDFLLKNLKLKKISDDVHWNVWTNIKKSYVRKNIFKKNSKYEVFKHLYFVDPNFVFWETVLGCFSQCFFLSIFWRRPTMVADNFTQPPTIKMLPTALYRYFWIALKMYEKYFYITKSNWFKEILKKFGFHS